MEKKKNTSAMEKVKKSKKDKELAGHEKDGLKDQGKFTHSILDLSAKDSDGEDEDEFNISALPSSGGTTFSDLTFSDWPRIPLLIL